MIHLCAFRGENVTRNQSDVNLRGIETVDIREYNKQLRPMYKAIILLRGGDGIKEKQSKKKYFSRGVLANYTSVYSRQIHQCSRRLETFRLPRTEERKHLLGYTLFICNSDLIKDSVSEKS